jgi:hypothetical protein
MLKIAESVQNSHIDIDKQQEIKADKKGGNYFLMYIQIPS